jgi:glucose-6-phosphate 1-dehydrogenase
VEKPFGSGLAEARRLNELVDRTVGQDAVFRIDHFLGKQTVQNVLGLRFANRVFEPVWNAEHIDRVEIIWFEKVVPHLAFPPGEVAAPNVLRLTLNPDRMALGLTINGVGDPFDLEHVELDTTLAPQDLSAYARLLLDAVKGDFSLSIRGDEAEESWRIVEPILRGWREGRSPLAEYPAGSSGPQSSSA